MTRRTDDSTDRLFSESGQLIANDIVQGILSDGINIRDNGFMLSGLDNSTLTNSLTFMIKLSKWEGKEIAGWVTEGTNSSFDLSISKYSGNTTFSAKTIHYGYNRETNVIYITPDKSSILLYHFHTHPGTSGQGANFYKGKGYGIPGSTDKGIINNFNNSGIIGSGRDNLLHLYDNAGYISPITIF